MEGMYLLDQPQLLLTKQTSLSTENISKNGIQKKVHYVVKNQPFSVEGTAIGINLHQHLLQARLLYDSEDLKEVGFIKLKPIEHKSNINERGDKFQIELRLKVLSSQLEDMLFRVELFVQLNHLEFGRTSVLTHPIKVVSKPEQGIKKKKEPVVKVEKEEKSEAKVSRKRTANDMLVQSLARIEQNCEAQSSSLEQLMQTKGEEPLPKKQMLEPISLSPKPDKFTLAFQQCVDVFVKMASEDRPEKIRKMISNRSTKEKDILTDLIEEIYLQESSKEPTAPRHFNKECQCTECPHKMELQRIDHFFNDFLSVPHGIHSNF